MNEKIKRAVLSSLLTVAVIGAGYLGGRTYAHYNAQNSATGTITIASWNVTAAFTGENTEFTISEGETTTYPFTVKSSSEVALSYDVILTLPDGTEDLTDIVSFVVVDADDESKSTSATVDGLVYTFADVGRFNASADEQEKQHELSITAISGDEEIALSGIEVKVIASQIQPN